MLKSESKHPYMRIQRSFTENTSFVFIRVLKKVLKGTMRKDFRMHTHSPLMNGVKNADMMPTIKESPVCEAIPSTFTLYSMSSMYVAPAGATFPNHN